MDQICCVLNFSPDGKRIVSASDDKTIRVWDAETGDLLRPPLEGHEDFVNSVAFSPDGEYIVSASDDLTIRMWDAETGNLLPPPLEGLENCVSSVVFSPDARRIVPASEGKTIQMLNHDTDSAEVCFPRGLSILLEFLN